MKIAVIDFKNQDIGLNILFPEAEYFVIFDQYNKADALKKYNINKRYDIENINDKNFDYLFIILAALENDKYADEFGRMREPWASQQNQSEHNEFYRQKEKTSIGIKKVLDVIDNNKFKKVCLFCNDDYNYDPSLYLKTDKIDIYFKRNYSKNYNYSPNVYPYSFIMFGYYSMIELIDKKNIQNENRNDHIYFSGTLFHHWDEKWNVCRDRRIIFNQIREHLFLPKRMNGVPFDEYLNHIHMSKYSLDLNGVGEPNKRTFEILSQGSLRIGEFNDLKWCFDDDFCEETIFKTADEFKEKINKLSNDNELYEKCLKKQNEIVDKYFNKTYLRNYLLSIIMK